MNENFLLSPIDNLNIYEQIMLENISEKEKIHNLAELDIELNKMMKSNPSTILKITLFLLKHGELIINLGIVGGLYCPLNRVNFLLAVIKNYKIYAIKNLIKYLL